LEKPIEKVEDILLSYTGDQTTFLKMLNNYKTNYLISFDKKINYLSNKIWIHIFLNQIDDKEYLQDFYKNQIDYVYEKNEKSIIKDEKK